MIVMMGVVAAVCSVAFFLTVEYIYIIASIFSYVMVYVFAKMADKARRGEFKLNDIQYINSKNMDNE